VANIGTMSTDAVVISFGDFRLIASERRLTKDDVPVELGARTLDTLIALLSHANKVVAKRDLIAQVWPDVTVEEGSLRFHIASLRRALGDGRDGARFIATLAGRGYCFVAPVTHSSVGKPIDSTPSATAFDTSFLPLRLASMVGRTDCVSALSAQLAATRFVTIVGPGGVGKTTVAVAVAHELVDAFAGAMIFMDLGILTDPDTVATSLASMLGLSVQSADPTPGMIAYLRDKKVLLVLDNCEHVIETTADLSSRILLAAPHVHILATSREALRVEGEHVHRLTPLDVPPEDPGLTAETALTFPAAQLFVERAIASGARLELDDETAPTVASICRRLDGIPLAIELAAGRVESYGLQQTASLLDQRLTLLWLGKRTAPPRQKTLQATLDWSFGLLSDSERVVLRRLAVFVGHFTLETAGRVVSDSAIDREAVYRAIDSLVAKSMIATSSAGATTRYRLLDMTRAYSYGVRVDDAELAHLAERHAIHYRQWLQEVRAKWPTLSNAAERARDLKDLGNVRAALEWCFGIDGNAELGVKLAAAAAPVFLAMSLLTECQRWSERAILALADPTSLWREELLLQAAQGLSLMFTRGNSEAARLALNRSLAIAEEHGDAFNQLRLLALLHTFHHRVGDFKTALQYAQQSSTALGTITDPESIVVARSALGSALHQFGDLRSARVELEAALRQRPEPRRPNTISLGFDPHVYAGVALARTLWLLGYPTQAVERARHTVESVARMDHPVTLSVALAWTISVFLWTGDLESAERHIDWFTSHAEAHSLAPYLAVGRGLRGDLAIRRGDAERGVESLQDCMIELQSARYGQLTTTLNISLVQGLAMVGRYSEGMTLIDETISAVEENGPLSHIPELLRVKGNIVLAMPQPAEKEAEACFVESLEWSARQGALAWELRAATDLAALWGKQRRPDAARALLLPVFARFVEGLDTADLMAAKRVLESLA
jgi:predicted ATPase/DNA-binding winged helix-turn-helix (wHTH) protein